MAGILQLNLFQAVHEDTARGPSRATREQPQPCLPPTQAPRHENTLLDKAGVTGGQQQTRRFLVDTLTHQPPPSAGFMTSESGHQGPQSEKPMATSSCLLSLQDGLALCLSVTPTWETDSPSPWLFVVRTVSELAPPPVSAQLGLFTPSLLAQ